MCVFTGLKYALIFTDCVKKLDTKLLDRLLCSIFEIKMVI